MCKQESEKPIEFKIVKSRKIFDYVNTKIYNTTYIYKIMTSHILVTKLLRVSKSNMHVTISFIVRKTKEISLITRMTWSQE